MKTYPSKFLSQPQDDFLYDPNLKPMGPLGPWATGKVRFDIDGGLIGLRPVVDRYSITTFSEGQWRKQNMETLKKPVAIHQRNQKLFESFQFTFTFFFIKLNSFCLGMKMKQ